LDFQVVPGDLLLIKGPSGSGKSTLLMNLLGLVSPTEGEVLINGTPAHKVRGSLSEAIGYVGPEPYMIQGSLKENLLFGHLHPDSVGEEQLKEALRIAELSDLAVDLNRKFAEQTPLSTGQKQRIAIARALVRKPRVLILDEATANLDLPTESKIIQALSGYFSECLTVVISHRASFDSRATRIVALGTEGAE
jgi:ABC-type bacteriocin/lantibiotic exporter with double-glycine peptidase domain